MLTISSELENANEIMFSFLEASKHLLYPGYFVCRPTNDDASAQFPNSDALLEVIDLTNFDLEHATNFHKFGSLVFPSLSEETSFKFFHAMLRGHVFATIQADDVFNALKLITDSICNQLPQLTTFHAQEWVIPQMPLVVEVIRDNADLQRTNIIDLGSSNVDEQQIAYIYRYDSELNDFVREIDQISFADDLNATRPL
jgi:hypothetical protein